MDEVIKGAASGREIDLLSIEIIRLNKIIDALTDRAERTAAISQTDFGIFQTTIILEDQVRSRTSELLRVKEQLGQSELKLRNILEHAPIGMAITDISARFILVNQAFCDIVGYAKEELLQLTPLDISYPDDKEYSRDMLQQLMEGKVDSYQIEKRYLRKDGGSVWVHLTTSLLCDALGNPQNFIAQILDITARRRSDEQLRLAATVYHASSEAMMVTDANNYIIATNPAFSALTGYSEHDVLGKNPRMLASGLQDKLFYQRMWQAIDKSGHWEGEIWNRKISGEVYVEWLSINRIRDDSGEVTNYVALFSDVTEKKKAEEQVWRHANFDTLTQLPNRRLFHDRLDQGILKASRTGESLALFFLDLDRFKEVNDTYGHHAGDQLLIEAARRISNCVRESDTVARLGGDEFTLILFDAADTALTDRIADSLIVSLAQPFLIIGKTLHVSASIGIARYPVDASDKEMLLKHADHAMYLSKNNGRNKYCYFSKQEQPIDN
jgi:diguanylate cyclase (GGDEF)-like protein/PAS domain S-box-containing protein